MAVLLFQYLTYQPAFAWLVRELVLLHDARREEQAALDRLAAMLGDRSET